MAMDTGLARRPQDAIEITTLSDVERLARTAVASGLVSVRRPEEAVVILLTGRELGLLPMQSLRGIHVVNGKPVLSADLLVAIVRRSGLCDSWQTVESTPMRCEIVTRRRGESDPARKVWTAEDAKRAGLLGKGGPWVQYPAQMLRHRCAADLVREVYPDVVLGLYSTEEMEDAARVEAPAAPVVVEKPEGSRAFAAFVAALDCFDGNATAAEVHILYHDLIAGLHEEGSDAADYLSGDDGAEARIWRACTLPLTAAERRAILTDDTRSLAAKVDAAAAAGFDGIDEGARWWVACRASLTAAEGPVVWALLARVAAGLDAPDATATGKAKKALKSAVEALTPPPPTGTDAPSAVQHGASVGDAAATGSTDAPAARAVREVIPDADVVAKVAGYPHRNAIEAAARKYAPSPALHRALAARLLALTPPDGDGGRMADRDALRLVEQWGREGRRTARKAA